jgi:protein-tyrosine phosphatase
MRLLFVCTGNVCRSPVAERLTLAHAVRNLGPDAIDLVVRSVGLEAPVGREMDPRSAVALTRLGGDPAGARAKAFTSQLADSADLVLTMTRRQRRSVLERTPRGLRRTFTLLEAADLLQRADLRGLHSTPLAERARELALRLDAARALRATSDADDVVDPIGARQSVHDEVAGTIDGAVRALADVLFVSDRRAAPAASGVRVTALR